MRLFLSGQLTTAPFLQLVAVVTLAPVQALGDLAPWTASCPEARCFQGLTGWSVAWRAATATRGLHRCSLIVATNQEVTSGGVQSFRRRINAQTCFVLTVKGCS